MSEAPTSQRSRGPGVEMVLIAVFALLVLGALWYTLSQRQQELRSSASGLDGLHVWLSSEGIATQSFSGGWPLDQSAVGLLILPLYDTVPSRSRGQSRTAEELLYQQDEIDIDYDVIRKKASRVPTLIVLPKWRTGMRLTGVAHPDLQVASDRVEAMLRHLTGERDMRLVEPTRPFTEIPLEAELEERLTAVIYAAQMFEGAGCVPYIERGETMLLANCPLATRDGEDRVLILSDPDLLNNHGLRLGDNALIAKTLFGAWAGGRNVVIDYSQENWLRKPRAVERAERSWADLRRFFEPPFTVLRLGGVLTLALFLWRGGLRYGPVTAEDMAPGAGKAVAIGARARLMRLSGQDGAMVREYAKARIAATAALCLGPAHARQRAGPDAFLAYVRRRYPDVAGPLADVLERIQAAPSRISADEAIRNVDSLERILGQISHET